MEHLNIAEFNRGQSSKLIKGLVENDNTAFIQKNGKPIAVVHTKDINGCLNRELILMNFDFSMCERK